MYKEKVNYNLYFILSNEKVVYIFWKKNYKTFENRQMKHTHAPLRTTSIIQTNGDHHNFFIWIPDPVLAHVLIHYVLVVTVELIWLLFLNILSFNFVPAPNKSL